MNPEFAKNAENPRFTLGELGGLGVPLSNRRR
jgi:hypothetical protein